MHALLIAFILGQAAPASFAPPSPTNQKEWLVTEDYPLRPAILDRTGFTEADIFIGTDGKPQACYIAVSSGWEDFDGQTCAAAMKRGKFKPAIDEAGKPMNGIYRFTVSWILEKSDSKRKFPADVSLTVSQLPDGNHDARVTLHYLVDETGRITRCQVAKSSGSPKFDALACRAMPTRYTFAPARDAAGKAWPVARSQTVGFELGK